MSALAGIAAAVVAAGAGDLTAAVLAPGASPFAVIGGALIDAAPPWAKDTAIALFGTADKLALLIGIGLVLLAVAALAGIVQRRRPPWGAAILGALGAIGVIVAMTRPDAEQVWWVPSAVSGVIGTAALALLARRAGPAARTAPARAAVATDGLATPAPDRRAFLVWTGTATALGVLAAIGAQAVRAGGSAVRTVRAAIRLPRAAVAAAPVPVGAELDLPGLAPVVTPNTDFYRIDTALVVPDVAPADWRLRVHGMVENEVELTWEELLALPLEESYTTLTCVSNDVGGDLIGNALWLGYPTRHLLARARPTADADMVLSRSVDGFTASTPLEALTDERGALLAVGMNGEPLPVEHGFPVRMVVPGLYGYVSATKWVTELYVTRFDRDRAYWTDRGWSARGPVKLQSRIDVPRAGIDAGETVIAGVAWHQHSGITGVEVQVDAGPWQPATLATAISADTWVQWRMPWTATPGRHTIRCRATGADGSTQPEQRTPVAPDGATGWHERTVQVT
ncbi:molybdopterin-dependent oxidoreductase [Microbacterium sp.]|uniref:molybdopterin-dependent oxidoreductase n=1 Tax=Microbacterium sp. TaxID=51671 RepID=UPI003A842480